MQCRINHRTIAKQSFVTSRVGMKFFCKKGVLPVGPKKVEIFPNYFAEILQKNWIYAQNVQLLSRDEKYLYLPGRYMQKKLSASTNMPNIGIKYEHISTFFGTKIYRAQFIAYDSIAQKNNSII